MKPHLLKTMGVDYSPVVHSGKLAKSIKRRDSDRVEFLPVRVAGDDVFPIEYHGSAHLSALSDTNGLLRIEQGINQIENGTEISVRRI